MSSIHELLSRQKLGRDEPLQDAAITKHRNAKAKFAAYADSQGFPSAIDFVVARVAAGKNLTSLWSEIGAAAYTSRRQFDNVCRHLSHDGIARIDAARTRRFGGNRA